jgi:hypothetical protein
MPSQPAQRRCAEPPAKYRSAPGVHQPWAVRLRDSVDWLQDERGRSHSRARPQFGCRPRRPAPLQTFRAVDIRPPAPPPVECPSGPGGPANARLLTDFGQPARRGRGSPAALAVAAPTAGKRCVRSRVHRAVQTGRGPPPSRRSPSWSPFRAAWRKAEVVCGPARRGGELPEWWANRRLLTHLLKFIEYGPPARRGFQKKTGLAWRRPRAPRNAAARRPRCPS